ncbi:hypothetical protein [Streptomyces sp. NPDC090022]|uniref:hypothetical protein n=1 Tax=Streptomyces sp. NPDC090022 TaxID=3365920 RepID=UPI00382BF695
MQQPPMMPQPPAPRRRSGSAIASVLVLVLVVGGIFGLSQWMNKDKKSSNASTSSSASSSPSKAATKPSDKSSSASDPEKNSPWKVGECGGPDPKDQPDGYRKISCSDSTATFKALEIKEASILDNAIQCPAGTDLIIKVSVSYGGKGTGLPTNTVCGRNLGNDHPGDAGAGGGQLVKGDCITETAKEVACASAGKGSYKVLDLVKTKEECPKGTTEPMRLTIQIGRPYDVICAADV